MFVFPVLGSDITVPYQLEYMMGLLQMDWEDKACVLMRESEPHTLLWRTITSPTTLKHSSCFYAKDSFVENPSHFWGKSFGLYW